jgi:hypothetical protein
MLEFTGISPVPHPVHTLGREATPAMKQKTTNENIVIPVPVERVKLLTRWALEASTWFICLGLLATSAVVAGGAALVWLISGSETILALGGAGSLLLGLAGVWHLLQRLDRAVSQLKHAPEAA